MYPFEAGYPVEYQKMSSLVLLDEVLVIYEWEILCLKSTVARAPKACVIMFGPPSEVHPTSLFHFSLISPPKLTHSTTQVTCVGIGPRTLGGPTFTWVPLKNYDKSHRRHVYMTSELPDHSNIQLAPDHLWLHPWHILTSILTYPGGDLAGQLDGKVITKIGTEDYEKDSLKPYSTLLM